MNEILKHPNAGAHAGSPPEVRWDEDSWLLFIVGHVKRMGPMGLADPVNDDDLVYEQWRKVFVEKRIRPDDAEAASILLMTRDKGYPSKHLKELLAACGEARRERETSEAHERRVAEIRRNAPARRRAAVEHWESLADAERSRWLDWMARRNPGIYPGLLRPMCLNEIERKLFPEDFGEIAVAAS